MNVEMLMSEFEKVKSTRTNKLKNKVCTLPYGAKRYMTCPYCDEIMEIEEITGEQLVYKCCACHEYKNKAIG